MCWGTMQLCASISCSLGPGVWGDELPKTTKCTLCLLLEHLHSQEQVILFILVTLCAPWPLGPSRRPPGPETLKTPLLISWDPKGVPLTPEMENLFGWVQWESCSCSLSFKVKIAYFRPQQPIWASLVNISITICDSQKRCFVGSLILGHQNFSFLPKILGFLAKNWNFYDKIAKYDKSFKENWNSPWSNSNYRSLRKDQDVAQCEGGKRANWGKFLKFLVAPFTLWERSRVGSLSIC